MQLTNDMPTTHSLSYFDHWPYVSLIVDLTLYSLASTMGPMVNNMDIAATTSMMDNNFGATCRPASSKTTTTQQMTD